jgi:hypothetical protein
MTAEEFIAKLAPVELERLSLIFHYLALQTFELHLQNGDPVRDAYDFASFLEELSFAAKIAHAQQNTLAVQ